MTNLKFKIQNSKLFFVSKLQNLFNHPGFRKYFANTGWLFAGRIFQMGIAFVVGVWVARYLGPAKFGLLSFARSFVGLFIAISTLGLDGIVVRELVKDESKRHVLLGTSFVLKLIGAAIAFILVAIAIYFTSTDNLTRIMVILIAASLIFQSFNVIDLYFQSKVVSKFSVLAQMISATLSALVKIYLIVSKASVIYFAAMAIFDMTTIGVGYLYFYKKYTNETLTRWKFEFECAKSLLKDSWPLMIGGISFVIFSNIDKVMIKTISGNEEVGFYSAGYRLVTIWYFFPGMLLNSLLPALTESYSDKKKFYFRIKSISSLLIWVAISIFIVYYFFAKFIINETYGESYLNTVEILQALAVVNILIFYNSLWNNWMLVENKTRRTLLFHVLTSCFNIILNIFLIKLYGALGAVYALIFSLLITYFVFCVFDKRIYLFFIEGLLLKTIWFRK